MKITDFFKNMLNNFKHKKQHELLLDVPIASYSSFINCIEIKNIINSMPQNLSEIEKAYYIYIELGKLVNEDPKFIFSTLNLKQQNYDNSMDNEFCGICKSISELYVNILKNIGISADLVRKPTKSILAHVDTILNIDGKHYIVNLISDLSRIKTARRINSFCFDLNRPKSAPKPENDFSYLQKFEYYYTTIDNSASDLYLKSLNRHYGKIDNLSRKDIELLDKKLGYSFSISNSDNFRGIYTDDTINLLTREFNDPELFCKYVLHNQNIPPEEILKYKLDYVFENIHNLTDFNGNLEYLEMIRYYQKIAEKLLSPEELSRLQSYVGTVNSDFANIISILKVKPLSKSPGNNIYYLYSPEFKKYINKTPEEIKEFIDKLDKDNFQIVGLYDRYNPKATSELEL